MWYNQIVMADTPQNSILYLDQSNADTDFNQKQNLIVFSKLGEGNYPTYDSGISIKFVTSGSEKYKIGHKTYSLIPKKYLVVNQGKDFECIIEGKNNADGVCIFLSPEKFREVHSVLCTDSHILLQQPENINLSPVSLHENIFSFSAYQLGPVIENISNKLIQHDRDFMANDELFYVLTEHLLLTQETILHQIQRIDTVKSSTRHELFRRLYTAKELIDGDTSNKLDISTISKLATLSEFHFIRTFRQVFGISPYKYHLKKRLNRANDLLSSKRYSVTEVAYHIGFPDVFSFSKAFKKEFGVTPSVSLK